MARAQYHTVIFLFVFAAVSQAAEVSPVLKVLQMMGDMKAKALAEKQGEQVTFAKFMQFCKDTDAAKDRAVTEGEARIAKLKADIEKHKSDAKVLAKEIAGLDSTADQGKLDLQGATKQRRVAKADYDREHADLSDSVTELEVGVSKLKSMMSKTGASAAAASSSLLQEIESTPKMPETARRVLSAFLAKASVETLAPEAATFESQSGGIVDMMDNLKEKMEDERDTLEKNEVQQAGSFQMLAQTLGDQISQHTDLRQNKASTLKDKESLAGQAAGDLADTENGKNEDAKFLADHRRICATKASDYESRQKSRGEEIVAITKAMEIVSGGSVGAAAERHLPSFVQQKQVHPSLAQLRRSIGSAGSVGASSTTSVRVVASFLAAQGRRINSRVLTTLAHRARNDTFDKVRKMIEDMVMKLQSEANDEAEHKGFCDAELGTNKMTRDQKETMVEELTAKIERMTSQAVSFGDQIADFSQQVSELDQAVAKATAERQEEKEKSSQTQKDAQVAATAVSQAIRILQDYYAKAAGAVLVQTKHKGKQSVVQRKAAAHDPYTGQGGETGIIGMLEVILADFERLAINAKESEVLAAHEYQKFKDDAAQNKAVKLQQVKHRRTSKMELEVETAAANKDLRSTQKELDAAVAYFDKLKPSCVGAGEQYEDRVQRRKEEIESLQEAIKILDGSMAL